MKNPQQSESANPKHQNITIHQKLPTTCSFPSHKATKGPGQRLNTSDRYILSWRKFRNQELDLYKPNARRFWGEMSFSL